MSEEIQNEATSQEVNNQEQTSTASNDTTTTAQEVTNSHNDSGTEALVNPLTGEVIRPAKPKEESSNSPYKKFKPETFVNPMTGEEEQTSLGSPVIIQKDRGLAYYVGFALLTVLSIAFYFMPGIAITFVTSRIVDLSSSAAWLFSAILSFGVWLIFKMKIKGFEKSFKQYLVLCVACVLVMVAIQFATNYNIFAEITALLIGAKA